MAIKCEVCKATIDGHIIYWFYDGKRKKEHTMCDKCYGEYLKEVKNARARLGVRKST